MTSWIVRGGAKGDWERLSRQHEVVAVGWTRLGDLADVDSREALEARLHEAYPDRQPTKTTMLWQFVGEMRPGDVVVMPYKGKDEIAVGEIAGGYRYQVRCQVRDKRPRPRKTGGVAVLGRRPHPHV